MTDLSAQERLPPPDQPLNQELPRVDEVPPPPTAVDRLPPLAPESLPIEPPMCERVRTLIDKIAMERERLIRERALALQQEETIDDGSLPPAPSNADPRRIVEIEQRLIEWEKSHSARLTQLRDRIEQLDVLLAQPARTEVVQSSPADNLTPAAESPPTQLPPEPPPTDTALPQDSERWPFSEDGSPVPVTQSPVDRIALANNLFGAERYALALEIYQNVAAEESKNEKDHWIRYQIACCHRQTGNSAEAEKNYRVVAAEEDAPFLAEKARWWLDVMDKSREANETLARLQAAFGSGDK
ncbi:MAG: tetratricopeptide repeat protein [Pirellulales bacterium]